MYTKLYADPPNILGVTRTFVKTSRSVWKYYGSRGPSGSCLPRTLLLLFTFLLYSHTLCDSVVAFFIYLRAKFNGFYFQTYLVIFQWKWSVVEKTEYPPRRASREIKIENMFLIQKQLRRTKAVLEPLRKNWKCKRRSLFRVIRPLNIEFWILLRFLQQFLNICCVKSMTERWNSKLLLNEDLVLRLFCCVISVQLVQ